MPTELRRYDYVVQCLLSALSLPYTWDARIVGGTPAKCGDLVMLTSAPLSEWHLSFYLEDVRPGEYLLESVKTGKLAKWSNVGLARVDCERAYIGDKMRWTDAQYAFEDTFKKVFRRGDYYIELPFISGFDGEHVLISVRTRFGLNKETTPLAPLPYRKITQRALLAFLDEGAAAHKVAMQAKRDTLTAAPRDTKARDDA
jgi:hypothetical protein